MFRRTKSTHSHSPTHTLTPLAHYTHLFTPTHARTHTHITHTQSVPELAPRFLRDYSDLITQICRTLALGVVDSARDDREEAVFDFTAELWTSHSILSWCLATALESGTEEFMKVCVCASLQTRMNPVELSNPLCGSVS